MTLTEPGRARLLIVVGLVLFALGTWMQIVTDKVRTPWALLFNAAWLLFLLAVVALNLLMALRTLGAASKRPARFAVAGRRFVTPGLLSTGFTAMMLLLFLSNTIADTVNAWRDDGRGWAILLTAITGFMAPIVVLYLFVAWRGIHLELSPAGITWQTPIFRRLIPWQALAPGGPPRPHPDTKKLELAVVQPDLVAQRVGVGHGAAGEGAQLLGRHRRQQRHSASGGGVGGVGRRLLLLLHRPRVAEGQAPCYAQGMLDSARRWGRVDCGAWGCGAGEAARGGDEAYKAKYGSGFPDALWQVKPRTVIAVVEAEFTTAATKWTFDES